jgi:hypothetical protein
VREFLNRPDIGAHHEEFDDEPAEYQLVRGERSPVQAEVNVRCPDRSRMAMAWTPKRPKGMAPKRSQKQG